MSDYADIVGDLAREIQLASGITPDNLIPEADDSGLREVYLNQRKATELKLAVAVQEMRKREALKLWEPLPVQEAFHRSRARNRILRGSNRSGKTLSAAVELARAVTGQDPYKKYPETDGRAFLVGLDLMHVGQVFYKNLFRPGAFRAIIDEVTGKWRAYRPWDEHDRKRRSDSQPAPPLIPERFVEGIAWEEKGKNIPKLVRLTNGWEITFFSSLAEPPQGMQLDYCWFDEEIDREEWYPEMAMRLVDRGGVFVWSATPQLGSDRLLRLSEKAEAERQAGNSEPIVEEFLVLIADNPHIQESEKRIAAELLDDPEEARVRLGGEFASHGLRVFPEFTNASHVRSGVQPPEDWTRYIGVDPGRQVCAVQFAAVPPSDWWEQHRDEDDPLVKIGPFDVCFYDELYIRNCSAKEFGRQVAIKARSQDFEAFYIDSHMGRQTEMGSGKTVEFQYSEALKANGVVSRRTGNGFRWGSDDVKAGIESCRDYLQINGQTGVPRLIVSDRCVNFITEAKRYRYKKVGRKITDEPEHRGAVHLMATMRYLLSANLRYVRPTKRARGNEVYQAFQRKKKRLAQKNGGDVLRFAAGG